MSPERSAVVVVARDMIATLPAPEAVLYHDEIGTLAMPKGTHRAFNRLCKLLARVYPPWAVRAWGSGRWLMSRGLWAWLGGAQLGAIPCWVCRDTRCPQVSPDPAKWALPHPSKHESKRPDPTSGTSLSPGVVEERMKETQPKPGPQGKGRHRHNPRKK